MGYRYVCHPDGHDDNGGGFSLDSYAVSWSAWHSSWSPIVIQAGCTISDNGGGKVRITSAGNFDADYGGIIVNCEFSATYDNGRYEIIDSAANYIDIDLAYSSDVPTVDVRVGGALKTPKAACLLANGTDGHSLLVPCNQITQTVHEVDGDANNITLDVEGATLDIYGVDDADGLLLDVDDKWPVIKAAAGSSWSSGTSMLLCSAGSHYLYIDRIVLDGNFLTPNVMRIGTSITHWLYIYCNKLVVRNSLTTGSSSGVRTTGYSRGHIFELEIYDCAIGFNQSTRNQAILIFMFVNNCGTGIAINSEQLAAFLSNTNSVLVANCDTGMQFRRYSTNASLVRFSFYNNQIDIQNDEQYGNTTLTEFSHSIFFNDSAGGKILASNNDGSKVSVVFRNCVLGNLTNLFDTSRYEDVIPTLENCIAIQDWPVVDKDVEDFRLDSTKDSFLSVYNWSKLFNSIGATTPKEPAAGGGGGVNLLQGLLS